MQTWLWLAFFASFAVKMPMWPVHTWLAGCARGGADGGLGHPGRHPAEDGRLRLPALLAADVPAGLGRFRAVHLHAVCCRHHLHLAGGADAGRHEEADRLLVGGPYGLRDHGHLRRQPAGRAGRDLPDAQPRVWSPGALFLCVGVVYDRLHTREIAAYGGLVNNMPRCYAARWRS
jgi:NADH-quinone oxidoreductase subunit M